MTVAVDLGRKATKQTKKQTYANVKVQIHVRTIIKNLK